MQAAPIKLWTSSKRCGTTCAGIPSFELWRSNVTRETAEAYLSRGKRSKDDLVQAAACFEAVAAEQPNDAFLRYRLGLVYRELGDNRRAALNLEAAIRGGFRNLGAQVNLIEAAFDSRQSALALRAAKDVISPNLRSPDVLLRLGRLLFDHLFYKEALEAFRLASLAAPEAFEPRFRMALTHYLLKEYKDTVAALASVNDLESNPEAASLDASAEAQLGNRETCRFRSEARHAEIAGEPASLYQPCADRAGYAGIPAMRKSSWLSYVHCRSSVMRRYSTR